MAVAQTIIQLSDKDLENLITILEEIDPQLRKRIDYVLKKTKRKKAEALEYIVTENPVLWAKVYLNWQARDYQIPMLMEAKRSKQLVLRLGRRLGKSECMCVAILWFAYTQYNKGDNNQYNILIATPYETQIDLIFTRLHQLIDQSPLLQTFITRDVQHHMELTIRGVTSIILGLTAGANNAASGANSSRGQRADIIILDEADYIGSTQISNILNIRNEAPARIKLIVASTPSGKHEEYYKWCVNATKKYEISEEDKINNNFTKYIVTEKPVGEGNGWTQIHAPSNVNKEVLQIDPQTNQTYLDNFKDELPLMRYEQEVLAEFGEEELGVYQKQFIEAAVEEGKRVGWTKYIIDWPKEEREEYLRKTAGHNFRMLGIDWDKYGAATHMVCVEYDAFHQLENGNIDPCFKILFRIEIPRSEYTFINAMNKVIELNEEYNFDHIAVDRGYGEVQLEAFHKYGIENPKSGIAEKLVGYQFSEKIEVMDPYTRKKDKKHLKPFMVNNSVNLFEKHKMILNPNDRFLIDELEEYRVKSISSAGLPTYSDENEHAIDGMNMALLIFAQEHDVLLRKVFSSKIGFITTLDKRSMEVQSRSLDTKNADESAFFGTFKNSGNYIKKNNNANSGLIGVIGRSNFSGRNNSKAREYFNNIRRTW